MLKKEIISHYLVTLVWLVIITLLRWNWQWNLIWLWLGAGLGTMLIDLDQIIDRPDVVNLIKQKQFPVDFNKTRLLFHNALFQVFMVIFCFWVLSSTPSLLGKGMVMAMFLHLLKDDLQLLWQKKEEILHQVLFWPLKAEISFREQKIFVGAMLLVFFGLNLLLI